MLTVRVSHTVMHIKFKYVDDAHMLLIEVSHTVMHINFKYDKFLHELSHKVFVDNKTVTKYLTC